MCSCSTIDELDTLLGGTAMFPDHLADEVRGRIRAHADLAAMRPPDTFTLAEGVYLESTETRGTALSSSRPALTGTSACGGRVTARATVLADVTEAHQLQAGDILVTRQTDPGWGPVFPLIAGLVMERGGMLSHGAIIAREFGIPSIVGVAGATRLIPTGATICLDGDRGAGTTDRRRRRHHVAGASERRERATRTERAVEAARERACRGVRGAKPLGTGMTVLLEYARERLTSARILPAVLLVVLWTVAGRGWSGPAAIMVDAAVALALVAAFRVWDDLVDRERDRLKHPHRVTATARSITPLWIAAAALGVAAAVMLGLVRGTASVVLLFVYAGVLAASYATRGSRTAAHDRILLLKYGVFTLVLIGVPAATSVRGLIAAAAAFAIACVYEWRHDAESPVFSFGSFGGSR